MFCVILFFHKGAVHTDGSVLCSRFADEIEQMVKETIMHPLARDIDVELRFHAHAHLGVQKALVRKKKKKKETGGFLTFFSLSSSRNLSKLV